MCRRLLLCSVGVGRETQRRMQSWEELPDLIVHSIAIRLTGSLCDLAAFRGTCSAWRSVLSKDLAAIIDEFLKQHYQRTTLLDVVPDEMSWSVADRPIDDTDIFVNPGHEDMTFILKHHNATESHGTKFTVARSSYDLACLTAQLNNLNCSLVLVSRSFVQRCSIAGAKAVKYFPEGIIPYQPGRDMLSSVIVSATTLKDRLYIAGCRGRVVEVKMIMDDNDDGDNCTFSRKEIWSKESRRAYPVLGVSRNRKLLMFREDEKKVYQFDSSTEKWEEMPQAMAVKFRGCRRMPLVSS